MKKILRWRKMTWVLIIWCALILAWAIGGAASNDCAADDDACAAGTGLGVLVILFVGFFGFMFFAVIWFMTRPRDRR